MGFLTYQAHCKLMEFLNEELPKVRRRYTTINAGGCGVFANFLSEELTKLGIDHTIVWVGHHWLEDDPNEINKIFNEVVEQNEANLSLSHFHDVDLSCSHIMVEIGTSLVDATGVYNDLCDTEWSHRDIIGTLTQEQLSKMVATPKGWNDEFNRRCMRGVATMVKNITNKIPNVLEI